MAVMLILPLYILDCELMWSLQCFHCSCVCEMCIYDMCIFTEGNFTIYVLSIALLKLIYIHTI